MKKFSLIALLVLLTPLLPATAGTIKIPTDKPAASAFVPDSWEPEATDEGISCESPDGVATVFLEVTTAKGLDALLKENIDWLVDDQKVKISEDSKETKDVEFGEVKFSRISWDATSKEWGPAVVGFLFTDLGNGKILTVTYWITKKDATKHYGTLEKIFASVKPL
jgi:hypothetical protein